MKRKVVKYIVVAILLCVLAVGGYTFLSPYFLTGGKYDNNYKGGDLEANYKKHESSLFELKNYFESILPEKKGASFGYDKRNDRFYFVIREIKEKGNVEYTAGEDLRMESNEMNNLLQGIGWTSGELDVLLSKMKKSDCIGIFKQPFAGKPIKVTYREGGILGVAEYSYLLFDKPLTDSSKNVWEDKVGFRVYNDSVVFEYGYPL